MASMKVWILAVALWSIWLGGIAHGAIPSAILQATPTTGVAPLTVSLSGAQSFDPDPGDSITQYQFTFGDGSPVVAQTTPTISHLYVAPGTYVATLRVRDAQGNLSTTVSVQIVIGANQKPTAVLQATPTTGVAPLTVNFNGAQSFDPDAADSVVQYLFTFGDSPTVVASPDPTFSHTYLAAGTYVATLQVKDEQANLSTTTSIQIFVSANQAPTAVLQATPASGLSPLTVSFSGAQSFDPDPGDGITQYRFTFGDGFPVVATDAPTISHTYGAPGTYQARLQVRDRQGNLSTLTTLLVSVTNRTPTPVLQATPSTGSAPLNVSFSGAQSFDPDVGDRIVRYTFSFGDGSPPVASTEPTFSHLYGAPGTYVATLSVMDSLGTVSTNASVQVVVHANQKPTAALQVTPATGVAPLTVSLSGAQSSDPDPGDSIQTYTFNFGDGSPVVAQSTATISHQYSAPGTYVATLQVRDSQGNVSTSVAKQIVVTNGISISDGVVIEGDSGTAKAVFTVKLAVPSSQPVSVAYTTRDGTGFAGKDYVVTSGTLTIPAGATSATLVVGVISEKLFEDNETFFVELSAPTNAVITRALAKGAITNDDPSIGETTMTPDELTVDAGEAATLAVTWTHPVSWRDLETIDVRIVDGEEIVLWVRFRHEDDTDAVSFSVFNPASGKFGRPAAPGRPQQFESSWATLHLDDSSVLGPPGPSVTLNLRVSFKPRSAGRVYRVEAFATDDDGHEQGFDPVGTVTVRRR